MTDLPAPLTLGCVPGLGPGSVWLRPCSTRPQRAPGSAATPAPTSNASRLPQPTPPTNAQGVASRCATSSPARLGFRTAGMARRLSDEDMDHYRRPFADPGESRRPTLSWPRTIPVEGKPPTSCRWSTTTAPWLAESDVPKLLVSAEPGAFVPGRIRDVIRSWPNLTETTASGHHPVGRTRIHPSERQ